MYMDYNFSDFFDSYATAFNNQDMDSILEHFHYPCLLIAGQHVIICKDKDDMHKVVKGKFRYKTAGGVDQRTSYSLTSLIPLDENNQIVSILWRIENKIGQEVSKFPCTYQLLQKEESFKIVVTLLSKEKD